MVSNAFSSNGYAVPETSEIGKVNNLVLSWMGVILPGVATATLTSAILTKHFKKELKDYEDKFDVLNNKFDDVKTSMEQLEKSIKERDGD